MHPLGPQWFIGDNWHTSVTRKQGTNAHGVRKFSRDVQGAFCLPDHLASTSPVFALLSFLLYTCYQRPSALSAIMQLTTHMLSCERTILMATSPIGLSLSVSGSKTRALTTIENIPFPTVA